MTAVTPIRRDDASYATGDAFRAGMRQLASGVSLITAGTSEAPVGLVATAVCSVSVEPPTLLVSISRSASAYATIDARERFVVNILSAAHHNVVEKFSHPERREERFSSESWIRRPDGPVLLAGAIAAFDCRVVERLHYATHTIFLARPLEVSVSPGAPLVHYNRQLWDL